MKISANLHYVRMAPRKVRAVANVIRGKRLPEAEQALRFMTRRAAAPLGKLLASAASNARHNFQITDPNTLTVSEVRVDAGATLKRRRPRARGTAFPIRKRTSHILVVLEAAGIAPRSRRPPKADIKIIAAAEAEREQSGGTFPEREREAFRERPKIITKPRNFVQRIFRRKAI